jgi:hypothetical protein
MKHAISPRWLANLKRGYNHLPLVLRSSTCETLVHFQSEDSHVNEMIKQVPPLKLTMNLE